MPDIGEYVEISDIEPEDDITINKKQVTKAYKKIYQFHRDKGGGVIHPQKCIIIEPNGQRKEIPTIAGSIKINSLDTDEYIDQEKTVSNYNKNIMKNTLSIDLKSNWNGSLAGIKYNAKDTIRYFQSDFYTQASFSRILLQEAIKNAKNNKNTMSFRKHYLHESDLLFGDTDNISTGGSAGAIIIGQNKQSNTEILIGKRSRQPYINKNRYSIIPNSNIKYKQLKKDGIQETVQKGVSNELINNQKGMQKFANNVEIKKPYIGWNLRDCSLFAIYYLLVKNPKKYESVKNSMKQNQEFQKIVEIPIKNYNKISTVLNINNTSPENIPPISKAIQIADRTQKMDDINYTLNNRMVMN